jgi:PAS domain S-box-containing protein
MEASTFYIKPHWWGVLLMSVIFLTELTFKVFAGTVSYIFVLLCVLWLTRDSRIAVNLALFATFLLLVTLVALIGEEDYNRTVAFNRILCIPLVWAVVVFAGKFHRLYRQQQIKGEQLNALFEHANEGILFADNNGRILLANPFLEKMFRYDRGELPGKNITELMSERRKIPNLRYFESFCVDPKTSPSMRHIWAKDKNGLEFPVEINLSRCCSNRSKSVIAFVIDATEKERQTRLIEENFSTIRNYNQELEEMVRQRTHELEQTNAELKRSQYFYKAMAQNFPGGIIGVLDQNMKYILVDGKDLHQLGLNEKTVVGDRIFENKHSAITNFSESALREVYNGISISQDIEFQGKDYNLSAVPIENAAEQITEILVVIKDISRRKRLEKELVKTLEKEKELNVLKSRFVTMASHEFRTPLSTILSSAFLLDNYYGEQLESEKKKHIDRIRRSVQGLTEILNDFLSLGKLEEGRIHIELSEISPRNFVEELLQEVSGLKKADQRFDFIWQGGVSTVMTDKQLLRNILLNLISNAIKYSQPQGVIGIRGNVDENELMIAVTDNGIGIPREEQKHLFKRFFRAHNVSGIEGTGLGLNIVKKYVKLLKGRIEFESSPGSGTTFMIHLPLNSDLSDEKLNDHQYELQYFVNRR